MRPRPGMGQRHIGDDVAAEPVDAALLGELVDDGRVDAGVDRAAGERHATAARAGRSSASISATAASTGTDGWHTARRARRRRSARNMSAQIIDVVVEIEAARRTAGTSRASCQSVM